MKVHTKVIYQMTNEGLELIQDTCHEYEGDVAQCGGSKGGGQECPTPPDTPYTYQPQATVINPVANAAGAGAGGINAAPAQGIAALPGAPGAPGPAPLGGPGGAGAAPMSPGMNPQVNPMDIMGMGGQQPPPMGAQINQFDPNNPYNMIR